MLALAVYESGICECGFHESLTDPSNFYTFEDRVCPVCKGIARYGRVQDGHDETYRKSLGENPSPNAPDPADGRRTFVRPMSPLEIDRVKRRSHGHAR